VVGGARGQRFGPQLNVGGTPCEESLFVSWRSLLCWGGLFSRVPAWLPLISDVRLVVTTPQRHRAGPPISISRTAASSVGDGSSTRAERAGGSDTCGGDALSCRMNVRGRGQAGQGWSGGRSRQWRGRRRAPVLTDLSTWAAQRTHRLAGAALVGVTDPARPDDGSRRGNRPPRPFTLCLSAVSRSVLAR